MTDTAALGAPAHPTIEASGIGKTFGDQIALHDIDLSIAPGVIVGVIGPSGCGKTTLIRLLTGIARPTSGEVRVFGQDPSTFGPRQRMRFGYMPQLPVLFPNLTVWGNLTFIASVYGMPMRGRRRRLMRLLDLVDLVPHRGKKLADCSGGMQRRLSLAATLVHEPELLYLDEPTAGVDPILRERFWAHFRDLRDAGKTVVVPTQYVGEAVSCDLVAVMAQGRLLTLQPPGALARYAYGGDPVQVRLRRGWMSAAELDRVRALDAVVSLRPNDDGLLVVLDDVGNVDRLKQLFVEIGAPIDPIEPVEPSFDQVFVEIIDRETSAEERSAA